jgi:phage terminase large subunit
MELETTVLYLDIEDAIKNGKRYIFLRGSSRSGKTFTALQHLIITALTNPHTTITIARETQVSIKNTILVDFKDLMESLELWDTSRFNKVEMVFRMTNGSTIRFIGLDDTTGKLRGMKSDYIFIDEVNTIEKASFIQLDIRCEKYIIAAYNPEVTSSWWGFEFENKENGIMLHSTWRMNPFLDERIIKSIQDLKKIDPEMYEIYSEGRIVEPREKIFIQPKTYKDEPKYKYRYIGIDWGYSSDECAVVEVLNEGKNIFVKELFYKAETTNEDLIYELQQQGIDKSVEIVADSSEPKSIEELRRAGFRIRGVKKGKGSVLWGISKVKQYNTLIHEDSLNLINEFENYKFKKDRSGRQTNQVTGKDHLLDALRYVVTEFIVEQDKVGKYYLV